MHGIHRATRQEYAIKVLDKGHLKRNNKLGTALAEKNTLVRLGSGHPGIVRLHWAFQDNWSLCELLLSLVVSFLCWQRVIPQSVSSIDSATTQPPLASPRVVTFLCPRPCYGRRSDCHDFLPAKISTPPSNDGSALRLSRHVREPPHISFFGHTYSLPDDRLEQCPNVLPQTSS